MGLLMPVSKSRMPPPPYPFGTFPPFSPVIFWALAWLLLPYHRIASPFQFSAFPFQLFLLLDHVVNKRRNLARSITVHEHALPGPGHGRIR